MNAPTLPHPAADYAPPSAITSVTVLRRRAAELARVIDDVIEEVPVALVYNGISHAVMLATPDDLEDFALGFSLTEGIIRHAGELHDLDVHASCEGLMVEMRIAQPRFLALKAQRRSLAGRTGCGLCGVESLSEAVRERTPPRALPQTRLSRHAVDTALRALDAAQPLRERTGSAHAAAWAAPDGRLLVVREDVGRHNALDKLAGALSRSSTRVDEGFVLISSRASYEMVQKTAAIGAGALVAVSAPTAYAVRSATQAGLMLAGFARQEQLVVYTGVERLDT